MDHLFKFGLNSEDLFIDEGKNTEIKTIREFLDSGGALTDKPIRILDLPKLYAGVVWCSG